MAIKVLSAKYVNEAKTLIDVQVVHPVFGEIPYTWNTKTANESLDAEIKEEIEKNSIKIADYVAPIKTDKEIAHENNAQVQAQIDSLEKTLIRPLRELLSTTTSSEVKTEAQTKVDDIEAQIKTLRSQLIKVEE